MFSDRNAARLQPRQNGSLSPSRGESRPQVRWAEAESSRLPVESNCSPPVQPRDCTAARLYGHTCTFIKRGRSTNSLYYVQNFACRARLPISAPEPVGKTRSQKFTTHKVCHPFTQGCPARSMKIDSLPRNTILCSSVCFPHWKTGSGVRRLAVFDREFDRDSRV